MSNKQNDHHNEAVMEAEQERKFNHQQFGFCAKEDSHFWKCQGCIFEDIVNWAEHWDTVHEGAGATWFIRELTKRLHDIQSSNQ